MKKLSLLACCCLLAGMILTACGEDDDATAVTTSDLTVTIDTARPGYDISPYIYGLAGGDDKNPNYSQELKVSFTRWGGNPASRFNWVLGNAWNAARDWEFRNGNYTGQPRNAANDSISYAQKSNMTFLLTIPTLGWVAKNTDNGTQSVNVPAQGGAPVSLGSSAIAGYDPAANRARTSVQSLPRKNALFAYPPDPASSVIYQDEWVANLVKEFGPADKGGVKFYAMDNEPDLWDVTHTDVNPTRMSYDEMLQRYTEYAAAVKAVDPTAQVTGPVSYGWLGYFYSSLDRGNDNFHTAADRAAHGNMPFLPWFLQSLKRYEGQKGTRLLDVLDIHYYPQGSGIYEGKTDEQTNALRLRSTRALWDKNYTDESWIKSQVNLIPRMRDWINTYYPGTKLGITEWNWGADDSMNGALAIAMVLGIYGREGVYLANYWRFPPSDSPGFYAFKMFTNFDNAGGSFGDKSLPVKISNDQRLGSFAALDSKSGRMRLMLINQQPETSQTVTVQGMGNWSGQTAKVYTLGASTNNRLSAASDLNIAAGSKFNVTVPAYSIVLLDLQPPVR